MTFDEYKRLRLQGLDPQDAYNAVSPTDESTDSQFSLAKTIGNIPRSAGELIGGVGSAVIHPIRTAKAIGSVVAGGVEKLIPGVQAEEAAFDSLKNFYGNRYGSFDKFLTSVQEDPVGVVADAATVLTGGGAIASKLGKASKIGTLEKAGEIASRAGAAVNPLQATGVLTQRTKALFPKLAQTIEKSNLRLTKTKEGALATEGIDVTGNAIDITKNRLNEVTDFLAKQQITGSPVERFAKASSLYTKTEDALDSFFGSMSKGSVVKKEQVVKALQGLKGAYTGNRDIASIKKQIDGAIGAVKSIGKGDTIEYGLLNRFKRSTYNNAYNKAGEKVVDGVEHSIADVVRGIMDEDLRGLKIAGQTYEQFMDNYGKLIESRKLLKMAVGKPEIGAITERVLGGLLGYIIGGASSIGGPAGTLAGVALGKGAIEALPVTKLKSIVGSTATNLSKVKSPVSATKIKGPLLGAERITASQR